MCWAKKLSILKVLSNVVMDRILCLMIVLSAIGIESMAQAGGNDASFNVADNGYWGNGQTAGSNVNVVLNMSDGKIMMGGTSQVS